MSRRELPSAHDRGADAATIGEAGSDLGPAAGFVIAGPDGPVARTHVEAGRIDVISAEGIAQDSGPSLRR